MLANAGMDTAWPIIVHIASPKIHLLVKFETPMGTAYMIIMATSDIAMFLTKTIVVPSNLKDPYLKEAKMTSEFPMSPTMFPIVKMVPQIMPSVKEWVTV